MSGFIAVAEEKAGSKQCPQVQVNEYKENENIAYTSLRPIQITTRRKAAKVYLYPFSLSNPKLGLFKLSKSPVENKSSSEMVQKKTDQKKTCRRVLTSKMKALSSKAESCLLKPALDSHTESSELEHKSISDPVTPSVDMESSDEDSAPGPDDFSGLSPYERKRMKNIRENANFFASLQLAESAARLRGMIKKNQPPESKRKRPKKKENEVGCRRSMRLLKVDPLGVSLPASLTQPTLVEEETPMIPPGPLEMIPENQDDRSELFKASLKTWAEMSQTSNEKTKKGLSSIKSYKASLSGMVVSEATIRKVTKGAISSVAIHPSGVRTLVAAGSKSGQVGLWDLTQQSEDGAYAFCPHSQPVSCLSFSPTNPAHLLSLSYDGTVRCGDFSTAVFEEVYRNERNSLSSFDFLDDASTLLVGHWSGHLSLVDRRTPGTSYEKFINSSLEKIRTVHVHPLSRQYFITAGLRDVHVYDVRCLKSGKSQPLISLTEHSKSIASAYFSPVTGNRVVTTCADCKLRVFDSSSLSSQFPLVSTIRHNTITGRWLTRFQAVWDPKQEDCFTIGSMAHPRRVEVFHETGKNVHSFGGECLVSVCSLSVMHPTRYILAGGNCSGRLHVFMHQET